MNNPYNDYYINQAGSGFTAFYRGQRVQRGHGFFGDFFRNILIPLGKYIGRQAVQTGVNIGNDFIEGKNIFESVKDRVIETGDHVLTDAYEKVKNLTQTGKGRKRKTRKRKKIVKKRRKSVKSRPKKQIKGRKKQRKRAKRKKKPLSKHLNHIFQ